MPRPTTHGLEIHDVIQLDPDKSPWGPVFAIVDQISTHAVRCYFYAPLHRGQPPNQVFMRVSPGEYVRIGPSHWVNAPQQEAARVG